MTSGTVEIGPIAPEHFERWHDIRRQAFGGTDAFDAAFYEAIDPGRVRAATVDGVLAAVVIVHPYEQTWGGVAIPCGGVSGVIVAPEARGRGLARRLLRHLLDDMAARGEVVSTLYPTTATLYRSLGFETAGSYDARTVPSTSVPAGYASDLSWGRVDFADPLIAEIDATVARQHTGWLTADSGAWERRTMRWRAATSTNRYAYVGRREEEPVATVVYHYAEPDHSSDAAFYQLETDVIAAVDAAAWRSTLALLGQQTTTSSEVRTALPEPVLASVLPHLQLSRIRESVPWMLRLVDVAGAVATRPVPAAVSGRVSLAVADDQMAANRGNWMLEVGGGAAKMTPGGDGAVALTIQTLARVYAGADVRTLAASGLLPGAGGDDCDLLAATFTGTPHLQFFF